MIPRYGGVINYATNGKAAAALLFPNPQVTARAAGHPGRVRPRQGTATASFFEAHSACSHTAAFENGNVGNLLENGLESMCDKICIQESAKGTLNNPNEPIIALILRI